MPYKYTKTEFYFLIFCLLIFVTLLFGVFQSFLGSFIFASIFAATLLPAHRKLCRMQKIFSKKISAVILILLLTFTLFAPLTFIIINSVDEIFSLINVVKTDSRVLPSTKLKNEVISEKAITFLHDLSGKTIPTETLELNLNKMYQYIANQAITWANNIANNLATFMFNFVIFAMTIYILLTNGAGLKRNFFKLSLLPQHDEEILLKKIENLNRVLLLGNLLGGLIQSLVGFITMSFLNIEKIFFWSLLILLCSFVPVLGPSLIFIPMGLYFWFTGEKMYAIVYVIIMSSTFICIENWFKPKFIGGRIQMHSLIILFSMLGGVNFFGIAGIFYGPLITTIFLFLFEIYFQQSTQVKK